jgi:hypothetical protein
MKILAITFILTILGISSMGVLFLLPSAAGSPPSPALPSCTGDTLTGTTLVSGPPPGATSSPDDITVAVIKGFDNSRPTFWVEWQNNVNPDGTPSPTGVTSSIVTGYDLATGKLITEVRVVGHVDGLTADPLDGTIIATSNEDANSYLALIYPVQGTEATYAFNPSPEVSGNGGTDSIALLHGHIYISHSNPSDVTQPTTYEATLDQSTLTADLTPVYYDNSPATSVNTGGTITMALTDPDTNFVMPRSSPMFAGDLATISQGDGLIIFAAGLPGTPKLSVLSLTDNVKGNVPPIDGLAVATSDRGTLYVVDSGANSIIAFSTTGCAKGTVFVGEPNDNSNPLVGTFNLATGKITPFTNHFVSPKGMIFVPSGHGVGHSGGAGNQGDSGNNQGH